MAYNPFSNEHMLSMAANEVLTGNQRAVVIDGQKPTQADYDRVKQILGEVSDVNLPRRARECLRLAGLAQQSGDRDEARHYQYAAIVLTRFEQKRAANAENIEFNENGSPVGELPDTAQSRAALTKMGRNLIGTYNASVQRTQQNTKNGQALIDRANNHDSEAQLELAENLDAGKNGFRKDPTGALKRYLQAAAEGNANAYGTLADIYRNGTNGVEANPETALAFDRKAALAGDVNSFAHIGDAYASGKGVKKNLLRAYAWYDAADEAKLSCDTAKENILERVRKLKAKEFKDDPNAEGKINLELAAFRTDAQFLSGQILRNGHDDNLTLGTAAPAADAGPSPAVTTPEAGAGTPETGAEASPAASAGASAGKPAPRRAGSYQFKDGAYTVQSGDSLSQIAKAQGALMALVKEQMPDASPSMQAYALALVFAKKNQIDVADSLDVGQKLTVPSREEVAADLASLKARNAPLAYARGAKISQIFTATPAPAANKSAAEKPADPTKAAPVAGDAAATQAVIAALDKHKKASSAVTSVVDLVDDATKPYVGMASDKDIRDHHQQQLKLTAAEASSLQIVRESDGIHVKGDMIKRAETLLNGLRPNDQDMPVDGVWDQKLAQIASENGVFDTLLSALRGTTQLTVTSNGAPAATPAGNASPASDKTR